MRLVVGLAFAWVGAWSACEVHRTHFVPGLEPDAESSCGSACVEVCPGGGTTTITGTAFAPNGTLPLYNANVFIPSVPLAPFTPGVSCDRCSAALSGAPIAQAVTGPDGRFTLEGVPAGTDVPLVIQLGRWRRQITIPAVPACELTTVAAEDSRLPRNRYEGDIPQLAIATGAADPFECLLLKIGIDGAELGDPNISPDSRVHYYRATDRPGIDLPQPAPKATQLYPSLARLLDYDALLLPCEGGGFDKSRVDGAPLPSDPRALLAQYVNLGGRVFATHLSYTWLTYPGSPFNRIATPRNSLDQWPVGQLDEYDTTIAARVAVTFPKGADFAAWLGYAGASSAPGSLNIAEGRHDVTGVDPSLARPWVTYDFPVVQGGPGVMHFTFNTPLEAPPDNTGEPGYCGRVVFSDFHVTAGSIYSSSLPFPATCRPGDLSDQEKALAFMLFDLTSCVESEIIE